VGLYIQKQTAQEAGEGAPRYILIVSPIEDTPAYRAGLHAQDLIVAIEGESTADFSIDEVQDRLRGTPGTEVTITIKRGTARFPVTLERANIEIPVVKYDMIDDDIGYLRIIQFTPHTPERVREAIESFKEQNFESMVIDLRSNPGGLLDSVIKTVDLFFDGGLVVGTRSRIAYENEKYNAAPGKIINKDIPITVLINNGSASAAEIMAGALKDRDRATLIGETTYGKGSVQQIRYISTGGFRLTMSRYYTPDGTIIDKVGIDPDVTVSEPELTEEEEAGYVKIMEQNLVEEFLDDNPDPSDREIENFIEDLRKDEIQLREIFVRRLIQNRINAKMDFPPVYNLELDKALRKAVEMLEEGKVN
jgi:carboxyl-terminal processing protease